MEATSSNKIASIFVLSGSRWGNSIEFSQVATLLGSALARRKINLVYGGGSLGLMGNVASMAASQGRRTLGVVIGPIKRFIGKTIGQEIHITSIHERLPKLLEYSDAFIVLPGGLGTIEDIFHLVSWLSINIHLKPVRILNVNGFYDGLLTFLDHSVQQGFMTEQTRQLFITDPDPEQLIEKLHAFKLPYNPAASQLDWFGEQNKKRKVDLDLNLSL